VPYVPKHTLSATAEFRQPLNSSVLHAVTLGANLFAAGDIMWDEANTHQQDFYATLGAHLSLEFARDMQLTLWGKNLTDTNYDTFRFDSMNRRYAQRGIPCHFGADLKVKF
jgi:outer membrane receptor protein involved in Fe transport